jgi:SAM-dependent methyltransferase
MPWDKPTPVVPTHWSQAGAGEHYAGNRWRDARSRERDVRLLDRVLRNSEVRDHDPAQLRRILDVPCGAGRLTPYLSSLGTTTGVDVSPEMIAVSIGERTRASAFALPFQDGSFDLVACCRLLHHLTTDEDRALLLSELARVARGPVALSYWDAASWHAWRRRRGLRKGHDTRVPIPRRQLTRLLQGAGLRIAERAHSMRFVSPQTWVLAVPE